MQSYRFFLSPCFHFALIGKCMLYAVLCCAISIQTPPPPSFKNLSVSLAEYYFFTSAIPCKGRLWMLFFPHWLKNTVPCLFKNLIVPFLAVCSNRSDFRSIYLFISWTPSLTPPEFSLHVLGSWVLYIFPCDVAGPVPKCKKMFVYISVFVWIRRMESFSL